MMAWDWDVETTNSVSLQIAELPADECDRLNGVLIDMAQLDHQKPHSGEAVRRTRVLTPGWRFWWLVMNDPDTIIVWKIEREG
ncbi:hypothetical protein [Streptomyces sp. NPDC002088]|uniref:hypothetical protein n=1 Tax=Streptomyces sp. NPDC002088 TaxID=3154665 RepID=UPI003324E694